MKRKAKIMQMATPEGLEPPTSALGKPCSIRLSYGVTQGFLAGRVGWRKTVRCISRFDRLSVLI